MSPTPKDVHELLADSPRNWGRWGDEDEIGALNFQTPDEVLRGARSAQSGRVFALGIPLGSPQGSPIWPGRATAIRINTLDHSDFVAGKAQRNPGGAEYADDYITTFLQGTTHYDGIGHMWIGDQIYNGYDAVSTTGAVEKCGVDKIARNGIAGRGVLIDVARFRGVDALESGDTITVDDLEGALAAQGTTLEKHDNVLVRTGWMSVFYNQGAEAFYNGKNGTFHEPGLYYTPELVQWFHDNEVVSYSTDTIGNENTYDPNTGWVGTLHIALMTNLGILFSEMNWVEDLAADCAEDGRYTYLYTAGPLHVVNGSGAPVNPIAIK
jgi:kynurenine formamidase